MKRDLVLSLPEGEITAASAAKGTIDEQVMRALKSKDMTQSALIEAAKAGYGRSEAKGIVLACLSILARHYGFA